MVEYGHSEMMADNPHDRGYRAWRYRHPGFGLQKVYK